MSTKLIHSYTINSIQKLDKIADDVISLTKQSKLILLQGDLGAGKTTFTHIICQKLGLNQQMSSPTYAIINEYKIPKSGNNLYEIIYHIDLYRLNDLEEAINIGIEDYLYHQKTICFIEWPEIISPLIENAILIKMAHIDEVSRQIDVYLYE